MSTGHDGSLTTLHANNARDSLGRLEMMMMLTGAQMPQRAMRQQVAAALDVIVHVSRLGDGSRKVLRISEVTGLEGDVVMMQDLYEFIHADTAPNGRISGRFQPSGIRSAHAKRLERAGFRMESITGAPQEPTPWN
jgi:pilus assembly protein CpaF